LNGDLGKGGFRETRRTYDRVSKYQEGKLNNTDTMEVRKNRSPYIKKRAAKRRKWPLSFILKRGRGEKS